MEVNLILPKKWVDVPDGAKLYYLAGPIRGAGDWQMKAIRLLAELDSGCYVVCPCRYDNTHSLWRYRVEPEQNAREFERQTFWEREYMLAAAERGCLIFWLPCESKVDPRPKDQGPYAQDTYGEIGAWRALVSKDAFLNLTIGAEPNFPGLDVIKANIGIDLGATFPVYDSLTETLEDAVESW